MQHDEMSKAFAQWNKEELDSFLIEITSDILKFKDTDGIPLVTKIRDAAGQKGTGKWTVEASLNLGIPVTLVSEAVFARALSSMKEERVRASKMLPGPISKFTGNKVEMLNHIKKALYAAKIISYAQGFMLFRQAAKTYNWSLNNGAIAMMWKGGCIIRSAFLSDIKRAFDRDSQLENLLFDEFFRDAINKCQASWRLVLAESIMLGIPTPAMSTAMAFYDGYRSEMLPANLLQAQRDYFGAHTFEYLDEPGKFHHVNWTGHGGATSSSSYQA
jgi:6-phosphogluconate dehydrogenase